LDLLLGLTAFLGIVVGLLWSIVCLFRRPVAEAAGVSLGDIIQIDYSWSEVRFQTDFEVCEAKATMSEPSYDITPEDVDVSDSVTVIWEIK